MSKELTREQALVRDLWRMVSSLTGGLSAISGQLDDSPAADVLENLIEGGMPALHEAVDRLREEADVEIDTPMALSWARGHQTASWLLREAAGDEPTAAERAEHPGDYLTRTVAERQDANR
jgi:hypothetical protein